MAAVRLTLRAAAEREFLQRPHKVGGAPLKLRSSLLFPSFLVSRAISVLVESSWQNGFAEVPRA